ncbi:MAG: hypothetical protein AAFQ05_01005 [Pseudomonadota bacterium]
MGINRMSRPHSFNPFIHLDDEAYRKLQALVNEPDLDFLKAVEILGLDPQSSFRGKDLSGLSLMGINPREFDFSDADLSGCSYDDVAVQNLQSDTDLGAIQKPAQTLRRSVEDNPWIAEDSDRTLFKNTKRLELRKVQPSFNNIPAGKQIAENSGWFNEKLRKDHPTIQLHDNAQFPRKTQVFGKGGTLIGHVRGLRGYFYNCIYLRNHDAFAALKANFGQDKIFICYITRDTRRFRFGGGKDYKVEKTISLIERFSLGSSSRLEAFGPDTLFFTDKSQIASISLKPFSVTYALFEARPSNSAFTYSRPAFSKERQCFGYVAYRTIERVESTGEYFVEGVVRVHHVISGELLAEDILNPRMPFTERRLDVHLNFLKQGEQLHIQFSSDANEFLKDRYAFEVSEN